MRGTTSAFRQRLRRPGSDLRQLVEAIAVSREAVKKLNADFAGADSLAGLANLPTPNDGVQLTEVATTALDHSTVTGGNYATQLSKAVASFQCARLVLGDTQSAQVEISSITARLNPANGGTQQVAFWNCQLFAVLEQGAQGGFGTTVAGLIPLGDPVQVAAVTTEGDVLFSWAGKNPKPRPKRPIEGPGFVGVIPIPAVYVFIWGTKNDGTVAANVGWACEAIGSYTQSSDTLKLAALTQTQTPSPGFPGVPEPYPGSTWWQLVISTTQTPRLKLVYNTGAAATITWSGAGNKCDLGGVPTNLVEFTGQGEIPAGSGLTYQVLADDGTTWVTFKDGQLNTDLANVGKRQTYAVRAQLAPSASSDATPTLRLIGVRELVRTDLSDVARVEGGEQNIDPVTLKTSIAQARLIALRDGGPDYRDAITLLLTGTPQRNIEFRIYWGSRALVRADWLLQQTFGLEDHVCPGPRLELSLISQLARIRGQLPVYNVGTGLRIPLKYAGSTVAAAAADILDGQLAIPGRLRGPGPADTLVVGKLIPPNAQAVISSYAPLKSSLVRTLLDQQSWQTLDAKVELDALAFIAGGAWIQSQGRVRYVPLCEGAIGYGNETGTASSATSGTLTVSGATWPVNKWAGGKLLITGGTGTGQVARVVSNTATVVTISGTWSTIPDATSTYELRTVSSFQLTPEAIVATLPASEILWGTVTPGFAQAVPEYFVPWNWNVQAQRLDYEYRGFNGAALLNLSPGRIDAVQICPTEIGQWLTSDGANLQGPTSSGAERIAVRQATLLGGGLLLWDYVTTYEWPELEEGDLVAVPTAYFVAQDPISNAPISGWLMAVGKIAGTALDGRRFRLWIRRWNDLIPTSVSAQRQQYANPTVVTLEPYIDIGGRLAISAHCADAASLKIASSTAGLPSDATVRAATAQNLDANGNLQFTLPSVAPNSTVYIKCFAYEVSNAIGGESRPSIAVLSFQGTTVSTLWNGQGSLLPTIIGTTSLLAYSAGGGTSGHMWVRWQLIADQVIRYPDGSTKTLAATAGTTYDIPAAPTLATVAGGSLGARNRWVMVSYVRDGMVYPTSTESTIAIAANNLLKVTAPAANANYDGWCVWVGSSSSGEVLQGSLNGSTSGLLAFGSDWTEPTTGAATSSTTNTPWNGAMTLGITATDLTQSQTYKFYAFADPSMIAVAASGKIGIRFASQGAAFPTTDQPALAGIAAGDGHIPLIFSGSNTATTPAQGLSGSGAGFGGRLI